MPKSEEELEAEKKAAKKAAKKKRKAEEAAAEEAAAKVESPKKKKKKDKKAKSSDDEEEAEPPKKKEKKEKKAKKAKKEEKKESSDEEEEEPAAEKEEEEEASSFKVHKKAEAGEGGANPTGTCEVYMGNLSFQIDEATLQDAVKDCGKITNFKWLEHSDTGRFKGAGFITFETPEAAAKAVAMNGTEILGRPMKVDFSTPRANKGGGGGEVRPMQEKPEGCTTLFCGNLSFNVTEEAVHEFFKECGAISNIRWLEDKETGQFKGCGFVEFSDPDASLDKAALLNGKELLGRTVRLDFATPRKPRTW
jgi:nucleolin